MCIFSLVCLFLLFLFIFSCYLQNELLFVIQCDKRFFWNEVMVKELLNSEVGWLTPAVETFTV